MPAKMFVEKEIIYEEDVPRNKETKHERSEKLKKDGQPCPSCNCTSTVET